MGNGILYHDIAEKTRNSIIARPLLPETVGEESVTHYHAKYELCVVLRGVTTYSAEGRLLTTDKPCICTQRPFIFHSLGIENHEELSCGENYGWILYFTVDSLNGLDHFMIDRLFRNGAVYPLDGEYLQTAVRLCGFLTSGPNDCREDFLTLVLAGFLILIRHFHTVLLPKREDGYIGEIIDYIHKCVLQTNVGGERLSVSELAQRFFVGEQKLQHDFKRITDDTVHSYILKLRVAQAAQLISQGKSPASAAMLCGFVSEAHFAKVFKAQIGMTPTAFCKNTACRVERT